MKYRAPRGLLLIFDICVVVAAVASCGGGSENFARDARGTIYGIAQASPQCPVQSAAHPCPPEPVSREIAVSKTDGTQVTSFQTAEDGRFDVALRAGDYVLSSDGPNLPVLSPVRVQVQAGGRTRLTLNFDTGIR